MRLGLGYDPFLGVAVRDVVVGAEVVEQVAAADAEGGFQRSGWVVETGMDYLFVMRCFLLVGWLAVEGYVWIRRTSELRLLVSVPGASCRSSRIVEVPSWAANCLAVARPTTPAPIT